MSQMENNENPRIFYTLLFIFLVSLLSVGFLSYNLWYSKEQQKQVAFDKAHQVAAVGVKKIGDYTHELSQLVNDIAQDLSSSQLAYTLIQQRLQEEVQKHPHLLGVGVAFQAYQYDPNIRLFAPYYKKNQQGQFELLQLEQMYDYEENSETSTWFHQSLQAPTWLDPYFDESYNTYIIKYASPFYQTKASGEKIVAGVVFGDFELMFIDQLIDSLDMGEKGYGYVLTNTGLIIAHPIKKYITKLSIFDRAKQLQDEKLKFAAQRALRGETFVRSTYDKLTGQASWIFHQPIPNTGWSIAIALIQEEFIHFDKNTFHQEIELGLAWLCLLWSFISLILRIDKICLWRWWASVLTFSVLTLTLIIVVDLLSLNVLEEETHGMVKMVDNTGLKRFLRNHQLSNQLTIPTGVLIQVIDFPERGKNHVKISGFIWQKYSSDFPPEITRGFMFPQQIGKLFLERIYHQQQAELETIGWQFTVTLSQSFNSLEYPLDNRQIQLMILPKDIESNVVLTPDLEGYFLINPKLLPGLNQHLVVSGWQVTSSFFGYQAVHYPTNFGIKLVNNINHIFSLSFNIHLQRNFLDSFIGYFIPLIVVALMIFAVLMSRQEKEMKEIFSVLSYAAAMFFVLVVAHDGLRDHLESVQITYIEYLYLVMYMTILLVSLNAILLAVLPNSSIIHYQNNLIPKLLYWPWLLGTYLIITLVVVFW